MASLRMKRKTLQIITTPMQIAMPSKTTVLSLASLEKERLNTSTYLTEFTGK